MIKQNIKIALFTVLGLISFWLLMFSFIKIDVATSALISFDQDSTYMSIDSKSASYIENHGFEYVKLEYQKQYFNCHITYVRSSEIHYDYYIILPEVIQTTESYFVTNIIIDSLNVYQYIFKK